MPSLSGTGGRTSGVNYATSSMYDRMYFTLLSYPQKRSAWASFAYAYQSNTQASAGSLKRVYNGQRSS